MKKIVLPLILFSLAANAQTQSSPPGSISRSPGENSSATSQTTSTSATDSSTASNHAAAGSLTFTNRQGQTYTVDQLAGELLALRSTVEQTMPMLSAFNETFSNSVAGDKSLTGKLTGILSGALNRNQNTNNASDQNSSQLNSAVAALQGLLGNKNTNSVPISANTVRDLETLRTQLQPVSSTLQNLNVDIGSGASSGANSTPPLTPTGKSTGNRSTP